MNKEQREYARRKIERIRYDAGEKLKKECTIPATYITNAERLRLIQEGKVSFYPDLTGIANHTLVIDAFDFSAYEQRAGFDHDRFEEKHAVLQKAYQESVDELYLGDCKNALETINKLAEIAATL